MLSFKSLTVMVILSGLVAASPALETRSGSLDDIFPLGHNFTHQWSTSTMFTGNLPLTDATFRPKDAISALDPKYEKAPDNRQSMLAHFPKGAYDYKGPSGGLSFYAPGPSSVDLTTAKEATLGYSLYFSEDYAFNKGGKLPGLYGGDTDSGSISCSGGRKVNNCFSVRLMWRTGGKGEIYAYVPPYTNSGFEANKVLCSVKPESDCNPDYGNSVGRGAFTFKAGTRYYVATRVKLNDAGKANGEIELWANGESVINVKGVIIRDTSEGRIRGIQMQTFFGGHETDWASPKTQDIWFSDFSVAITESL